MADAVTEDLLLDPPAGPGETEDLVRVLAILRHRPAEVPYEWVSQTDPSELQRAADRAAARARDWRDAREVGVATVGPDWQTVAVPEGPTLAARLDALGVVVPDDAAAADLQRLSTDAERAAEQAVAARAAAADLAAHLGVRTVGLTVKRGQALVKLSAIASSDAPPDALWLSGTEATERARAAVDAIQPLLEIHTAVRASAAAFDPAVLDLDLAAAFPEVRSMVLNVVAQEAPIVEDLVARRIVEAWRMSISERRRAVIRRTLDGLVRSGTLVLHGNAYAFPNQRLDVVRTPQTGDRRTERDVKQIPAIELNRAVALLVKDAHAVTEVEAHQRTARIFGWRRTGSAIAAAVTRAIEQLVEQGVLQRSGAELRSGRAATDHELSSDPDAAPRSPIG